MQKETPGSGAPSVCEISAKYPQSVWIAPLHSGLSIHVPEAYEFAANYGL
jgi:hypothetical protein